MSEDQDLEKRCSKCRKTKPLDAFTKDKDKKDGLYAQCKSCKAAYYAANVETKRAYTAAHADERREYKRAYKADHIDERREYHRAHRAAHPDYYRAANHRRRARIKGNGGNVTAHELATKRASQHGLCFYCRMPHAPQALTIDHVIPLDQDGPHIIANIVFACGVCNSSKRNRTPDQWTNRWYQR